MNLVCLSFPIFLKCVYFVNLHCPSSWRECFNLEEIALKHSCSQGQYSRYRGMLILFPIKHTHFFFFTVFGDLILF